MTIQRLSVASALVLAAGLAAAQATPAERQLSQVNTVIDSVFSYYPVVQSDPRPALTRAEVLADLQIWRASGLAALQYRGEAGPDLNSEAAEQARQRYAQLRSSPKFAELVRSIAADRGEVMAALANGSDKVAVQ